MVMDSVRRAGSPATMSVEILNEKFPDTPPPEYEEVGGQAVKGCPPLSEVEVTALLSVTNESDVVTSDAGSDVTDPWALPEFVDCSAKWSELDWRGKLKRVFVEWIGKLLCLLGLLYVFICSLDFLSSAFRLLGGKAAGEAFSNNVLSQNPIAGLMLGILATVLVQSSSTSTSIIVTMVASGLLEVGPAIPIVMGANIGTSITNTIVSLAQSSNKDEFRRSFGGATVHDMFNWLSVFILLPLECATGYLYHLSDAIISSYHLETNQGAKKDILKVITKPFTQLVIQLDKKIITKIATGHKEYEGKSLIKEWCGKVSINVPVNETISRNVTTYLMDGTVRTTLENVTVTVNQSKDIYREKCSFLFDNDTGLGDTWTGLILLILSITILCVCLVMLVKLLHSVMKGRIAKVINKTLNSDLPGVLSWLTGYIAIIIGAGMTIVVQSSSVFTSALTPMVGVGVITIDRMYPLTLGSNIGTTATGLLAALASPGDKMAPALQIAICHLLFNISGILLFYPVPYLRQLPIKLAKKLGNTTADYRWFPVIYLLVMFFFLPGVVFALSMAGVIPLSVVLATTFIIMFVIVVINILQSKRPTLLPRSLQTWDFLPKCLHSLEPLDRVIKKVMELFGKCLPCCCKQQTTKHPTPSGDYIGVKMTNSLDGSPSPSAISSRSTSMLIKSAVSVV